MALVQMFTMPMFFLSGALFPLAGLPTWLSALTKINPLTYAVDPMRRAVFSALPVPPAPDSPLARGVTWGTWQVPVWLELCIVACCGVAMLALAVRHFRRGEE